MNLRILFPIIVAGLLLGCKDRDTGKSRGPIVLGDSSTIVTERDPSALLDQVSDLQPVLATNEDAAAKVPARDTAKSIAAESPAAKVDPPTKAPAEQTGPGLHVPFREVNIFIPGIETRSYGKPDLQKARGVSYQLTEGSIAGKQLRVSGGNVAKVSQRYETSVQLKDGSDKLTLESLGKYTSGWQTLSGSGGAYTIAGLDQSRLEFKDISANSIRNAVQQAARKSRLSRRETQDWLNAARKVRSADQAPASIALRSVMWRIEGKGSDGKSFVKELRIDVPNE